MTAKEVGEQLKEIWRGSLQPKMRELWWSMQAIGEPGAARKGFESMERLFMLGKYKFIRDRAPQFDPAKNSMSWLPINKEIKGAENIALPEEVMNRLIDKAKHRVIIDICGCRNAMNCKDYPLDLGCLFMGESALKVPEKVRRMASADEAKAHVKRAIEAGLVPIAGKARADNDMNLIPDEGKFLTVCFCCECCCATRFYRNLPPEATGNIFKPVEGLSIKVTGECIGCGECVSKCYIEAIEMKGDRAFIGEKCLVCGRCASHCPQDAITLALDNPNAVDDVVRRIESYVDF